MCVFCVRFFWCFCFDLFYALRVSTLHFCFLPLHSIQSLLSRQITGYINKKKNIRVWCLMLLHQIAGKLRSKCANVLVFLRSFFTEGGPRTTKCLLDIDENDKILKNHSLSKPVSFCLVALSEIIGLEYVVKHHIESVTGWIGRILFFSRDGFLISFDERSFWNQMRRDLFKKLFNNYLNYSRISVATELKLKFRTINAWAILRLISFPEQKVILNTIKRTDWPIQWI